MEEKLTKSKVIKIIINNLRPQMEEIDAKISRIPDTKKNTDLRELHLRRIQLLRTLLDDIEDVIEPYQSFKFRRLIERHK